MSKSWEIDPDTRRKLLEIQKRDGNNLCADCAAPVPQWASPKFGIFICLSCAGVHRGLGVHISFVRSVTMDSFKNEEIQRMEKGGNNKLKEWFESQPEFYEGMTISERYSSDFAEDYKEKLTADVEGRPWVKSERPKKPVQPPSQRPISANPEMSQKERNEAYFQRLGNANESRPDHLPPSQGGKYGGFGSTPAPSSQSNGMGLEDIAADPIGALTKGWGFFTSTATRAAQIANEQVIKPTAQKLAEAEITKTATQQLQGVAKTGYEGFSRFVEGAPSGSSTGTGAAKKGPDPEHEDFWESFGQPAIPPKPSAIGTSAMKKPTGNAQGWDGKY
ncbi:hypothetical protein BZA77DRAFT_309300 [Pyronema omphalodes]|nr:hypothetical protein BZA77DRAFT_309300 [Pyronema omphalodes]